MSYCINFAINVGGAAGPSVGQRDSKAGPDCAATVVSPPVVVTPSVTPRPSGAAANTGTGGGIDNGPVTGVGSLSPTGTDLPVWAAILAGLGAIGVLSGLTLLSRLAPRRGRR